ncbi:hypothetical protein G6011_07502 [Alternaria panax]|uniref:DUF7730 domain-containing protein n=1 Tax=Alternaria panax TaxID=48097 RepID=A0AAD4FEW4_9PLEO|nr:hypothetical protein G6011_07502 [Alternaria panax]
MAMIQIKDDTYNYPTTPSLLQLLGLVEDDSTLWSFVRLLCKYKSIEPQMVPPNLRLLDDGMLDATPQSEDDKRSFQRNFQSAPLLRLPCELRNRIFGHVMGGFQIFISSKAVDDLWYPDKEDIYMERCIRSSIPSNRVALHEDWTFKDRYLRPAKHLPKVTIARTMTSKGPAFENPFVSLQRACRQIYTETATLPFSHINRFCYLDNHSLQVLAKRTRSVQIQSITKLILYVSEPLSGPYPTRNFPFARIQTLGLLTGLKSICINVTAGGSLSIRNAVLARIRTELEPKILEVAPNGIDLVFEFGNFGWSNYGQSSLNGDTVVQSKLTSTKVTLHECG